MTTKSYNAKVCLFVGCVAVLSGMSAFAGNVCTWQGGNGKFSDANWDVAPVNGNGDTLVFDTSNGTAITVENDLADDFAIAKITTGENTTFQTLGKLTLTGKSLYFNSSSSWESCVFKSGGTGEARGPVIQFDMPLRFKGGNMQLSNNADFNGTITVDDDGNFAFGWALRMTTAKPTFNFNAPIAATNAVIDVTPGNGGHGSTVNFNHPVVCRKFYSQGGKFSGKPTLKFKTVGNRADTLCFAYLYGVTFNVANAFNDTLVLEDLVSSHEKSEVKLYGDQTIDRITMSDTSGTKIRNAGRIVAASSGTLTMKGSANTLSCNAFKGNLSLVWDPQGDYTFTLGDDDYVFRLGIPAGTNTMTGSITVKGGTFALTNKAYFTSLSCLSVAAGAKFSLTGCTAAQPFPVYMPIEIAAGGHLEIPSGRVLSAANICVAGVYLKESKRYTKDNCDWITGDGAVDCQPCLSAVADRDDALGESCYYLALDWTNTLTGASVAPCDPAASNFVYRAESGKTLRTPQNEGTYVWHSHKITLGTVDSAKIRGNFFDCSYKGTITNIVENEGLEFVYGSLKFMSGRYGTTCWKGKITVLSPEGNDRYTVGGGETDATYIAKMTLAGTLHGAEGVGFRAGGGVHGGVRTVIDSDASDYYGTLSTYGDNGWTTLGNTVFNGSVVCGEGCAFGAERATDTAQVKNLSFDAATPFVVPVAANSKTDGAAGLIVVTNSFSQSAKVTVYHRGRMWYGLTPILKLAAGCTGTLDVDQFEFGGYMTNRRIADPDDTNENWPKDLRLEVVTENGEQILYIKSVRPGLTVIVK